MAIRTCPICMNRLAGGEVAAYSDTLECANCKTPLEVSLGSRVVATTLGLLAAWLAWWLTRSSSGMLGWVLPIVYAFFAYSVVAPLTLMFMADLVIRKALAVAKTAPAAAGNGGHH